MLTLPISINFMTIINLIRLKVTDRIGKSSIYPSRETIERRFQISSEQNLFAKSVNLSQLTIEKVWLENAIIGRIEVILSEAAILIIVKSSIIHSSCESWSE